MKVVGGASRALAIVLLCCSTVCGPAQTVDRGAVTLQPDAGRDAAAGTGGTGGVGGSDPEDPDGGGGQGGGDGGGTDDALPDAPEPDPDSTPPPPDLAPPPDSSGSPDAAPDTGADATVELPLVQVSADLPAASTNLTTEGAIDWRHWGYNSASASNRQRSGPGIISMTTIPSTSLGRYVDRPIRFSWTNGEPTTTVTGTPDGVVVGDAVGRGYEIRVTGNPARARTVRVYLGVWGARSRMAVSLAGQSGTLYTDSSLTAQHPGADRIYTVVFQPAVQSQVLILRWTVDALNQQYGNVTLQAVSVAESP